MQKKCNGENSNKPLLVLISMELFIRYFIQAINTFSKFSVIGNNNNKNKKYNREQFNDSIPLQIVF